MQRDVLCIVALHGELNITALTELCTAAGMRATPTRRLSTTTLRPHVAALTDAGLMYGQSSGFRVNFATKHRALRDAAERGRLSELATGLDRAMTNPGVDERLARVLSATTELDVALALRSPSIELALSRALAAASAVGRNPQVWVGAMTAFPALSAGFDRRWLEQLGEGAQVRLFELAVTYAEFAARRLSTPLCNYALQHPRLFSSSSASHSALFGTATLAGDWATAEALALSAPDALRPTLQDALAVARGTFTEEHPFVAPRKDETIGVARLLQGLLLVGRGGASLAQAEQIAQVGYRDSALFKTSSGWLKQMIELVQGRRSAFQKRAFEGMNEVDCLQDLLRTLYGIWADDSSQLELTKSDLVDSGAESLRREGQHWLAAQLRECSRRAQGSKQAKKTQERGKQPEADGLTVRPLFELKVEKQPWELSLEALERVAAAAKPAAEPSAAPRERILWRVSPRNLDIEPYLQVSKGGAFTRGRKLAVKQLLRGAKQLDALPPEDRAIAEHARERRETPGWGYPQVFHFFEPGAWLDLVGHPRVELQESEEPVEVVKGRVQVVAEAKGDELVVRLEPSDLTRELTVRAEPGKLVVYQVDSQALPLLGLLAAGLTLPASAKERALSSLGRLSHVVAVQTSERAAVESVAPDARLWLRVVPRGGGLLVAAFVKPLGEAGPELLPGVGAQHLLGHRGKLAVQTERALDAERAALGSLLDQCPLLEGLSVSGDSVLLEDVTSCLELLSVLQRAESAVVVEWPEGAPLKLRARVKYGALRGKIQHGAAHFLAEGTLGIDDQLSLDLQELLALVADSPGKFTRLASGDFIELERELRESLELLAAARVEPGSKQRGVLLSRTAFASLERLSASDSSFEVDREVASYRARLEAAFSSTPEVPRGLDAELRDYQVDGFRWLARLADADLSACLADDMGLGKTLQAIALLLHRAAAGPALVVAPTSVCDNWQRELARFAPSLEVRVFVGGGRERELSGLGARHVVITSYALLQQDAEKLQSISFATAILDEAQLIKNAESRRAQAACALNAKVRFALTGTPVENHLGDLYSIFRFLLPDLLGSWPAFNRRFGAARSGEAGNLARRSLKRLLKPYLLRRTKAQVLAELPPLTEIEHRVTLSAAEAALYEGVRRQALEALEAGAADPQKRLRVLAELTRLRRLCCHPQLVAPHAPAGSSKLDALLELIAELREGRHRALVFSQFVDVLTLVRARLDSEGIAYQYLDGSTPAARRMAAVDAFQGGAGDVFLISLKAGGFGLNLTAADYVIHVDPWWNPAVESQASDRAHRIGQTRPVTVYRLIAAGTIEERIVQLHQKKRELATSLLDESHTSAALSPEDLRDLLAPQP